jgi:hypothetical protein
MENVCYDVFVNIIRYLDSRSLLFLCSTCKNLYEFGKQIEKDKFTILSIERNIQSRTPIQDDTYYYGYVKIKYINSKTKKKWTLEIDNQYRLELFYDRKFYTSEDAWILRYGYQSGIKKISPTQFMLMDNENIFSECLTLHEAKQLKNLCYS